MDVNAQFGGARDSCFVFNNTDMKCKIQQYFMEDNSETWLVGDASYTQQSWLMVPVKNPASDSPEDKYNQKHALVLNYIKDCIKLLKKRFKCISDKNQLRYKPEKIMIIITACAVLHNMCVSGNLEEHSFASTNNCVSNLHGENLTEIGHKTRKELINSCFSTT